MREVRENGNYKMHILILQMYVSQSHAIQCKLICLTRNTNYTYIIHIFIYIYIIIYIKIRESYEKYY